MDQYKMLRQDLLTQEAALDSRIITSMAEVKPGDPETLTEALNQLTASEMARKAIKDELDKLRPKTEKMEKELDALWDMLSLYMSASYFMAKERNLGELPPEVRGETPITRDDLARLFHNMDVKMDRQGNHLVMTVMEKTEAASKVLFVVEVEMKKDDFIVQPKEKGDGPWTDV